MRLVSEGRPVGCLISRDEHRALSARAKTNGMTIAQTVAAMIRQGLGINRTTTDPATDRPLAETAGLEARQWQDAAERAFDVVAALRARLAEMEIAREAALEELNELRAYPALVEQLRERLATAEAAPVKKSKNCKLTEMLDEERARLALAYRSAGWDADEIAHELGASVAAVQTALMRGRR